MEGLKWIKIVTDIFDDDKILLIESMPDADSIIVIWFKLLCLAGKQNNSGVFLINERIPYTDEMFSTIFRRPLNTVRLALKTFEEFGMIEIVNNAVTIPKWEKHQRLDALEATRDATRSRVAKFRKKQKQLANGSNVTCNVTCNVTDTVTDTVTVTPCNADRIDKNSLDKTRPDKEIVLMFELPLKDGTVYAVTNAEIEKYKGLYPNVDVEQECRNMIGWCDANPARLKTKSGIKKFINNWLMSQQTDRYKNQSKHNTSEAEQKMPQKKDRSQMTYTELMHSMSPKEWQEYCRLHDRDGL